MRGVLKWSLLSLVLLIVVVALVGGTHDVHNGDYKSTGGEAVTTSAGSTAQQNAIQAAKDYLNTSAFSRQGLIDQLDSSAGDGYSVTDATYAVDHITVDWNAQAVRSARQYLQMEPMSRADLIQQLSSSAGEKFTVDQATYAAGQVGL